WLNVHANPSLTLAKTATVTDADLNPVVDAGGDPQITAAGDIVTYKLVVTNTGDEPLHNLSVTDPGPMVNTSTAGDGAFSSITCASVPLGGTLAVGAFTTCYATYTVTQVDMDNPGMVNNLGELTNTATAIGTAPGETQPDPATDTATVPMLVDPEIALLKTANPTTGLKVGDTVTYTLVATNTGTVTLSGVTIGESEFSGDDAFLTDVGPCPPTTLAPGDKLTCTVEYTVQQSDVDTADGLISNTATTSGTSPSGTEVTDDHSAQVHLTQTRGITLTKTASVVTVAKPGEVTYYFLVTNTGNTTVHDLTVTDPGPVGGTGTMSSPIDCPETTLGPAGSADDHVTCTATYQVSQGDIDARGPLVNTAHSDGTAAGQPVHSNPDTATISVLVLALPFTGGYGRAAWFQTVGGGVLALAVLVGLVLAWQRRRRYLSM
ncbi:MAG: DUF11 domain-containing protein, partial [Actinomycetia bacterium]|nr:DUF11 domain-containing protein [Actinomycetes bacterium]